MQPFSENDPSQSVDVAQFHALQFIAAVTMLLYPAFWLFDQLVMGHAVIDPLWANLLVVIGAGVMLGYSATRWATLERVRSIGAALLFLVIGHNMYLLYLNSLDPLFVLTLITALAAAVTVYFHLFPSIGLLATFTAYTVTLAVAVVLLVPVSRVPIPFFMMLIVTFLAIGLIITRSQSRLLATMRDNAEQLRQSQRELAREARNDVLTGLPNRAAFLEQVEMAIARARRLASYHFGVLFIDLDGFKKVNDSLGHGAGDELLIGVSHRLRDGVRLNDLVARLGGDEFVVLLDDVCDAGGAAVVAQRLISTCASRFVLDGNEVYINASIGIVMDDGTYDDAGQLLRDADTAMYEAKRAGKGRYVAFDQKMHAEAVSRLRLETELRRAVERHEFIPLYQPIFDLESGKISGFEALARWQHPQRGELTPYHFIHLAEEIGLSMELDRLILSEAVKQLSQWHATYHLPIQIHVNMSAAQFVSDTLVNTVSQVLAENDLDGSFLVLEVTEGVLLNRKRGVEETMRQLGDLGVEIALDDFGTGYSSLSYLDRFPISKLKIDRSFICDITGSGHRLEIVRAIISMSETLHIGVVAEGIESDEQLSVLKEISCDQGQGYLFARPLGSDRASEFLAHSASQFGTVLTELPAPLSLAAGL